jgi:hypothetical protein
MNPAELISDVYRLGLGYSVQWRFAPRNGLPFVACEWTPHLPSPRDLRRIDARYRASRDEFMEEVATRLGQRVLLAECDEGEAE